MTVIELDNKTYWCACELKNYESIMMHLGMEEEYGIDPSSKNYEGFLGLNINSSELFNAFITHPRFYPSDSGILPVEVQKRVEKLEQKFVNQEKKS